MLYRIPLRKLRKLSDHIHGEPNRLGFTVENQSDFIAVIEELKTHIDGIRVYYTNAGSNAVATIGNFKIVLKPGSGNIGNEIRQHGTEIFDAKCGLFEIFK